MEDKERLTHSHPSVAIIGAGLAGLSALRNLQEKGVECVLFEGSDRIGGRVYSTPHKSGHLQYGAEFINGRKNPMYEIAIRLEIIDRYLQDDDLYGDEVIYACKDCEIRKSDTEEFKSFTFPLEDKYWDESAKNGKDTVGLRFQEDYEEWISRDISKSGRREVFDAIAKVYRSYFENEWGAPVDKLAFQNLDKWDDYSGESASFTLGKDGFRLILDDIISSVDADAIRLNSVVTHIDYIDSKCRLSLNSGTVPELFDYVIVTTSVGHLKRFHRTLFSPELPKEKVAAIESLEMGNMMKVFLEYDHPFWSEDVQCFLTPMTSVASESNKDRIKDTLRTFQPLEWDKNILVCWLSGDGPSLITSINDTQLSEVITDHLRESLKDDSIPYPIRLRRQDWYSDPLFLGSYSFITPQAAELGDVYGLMADPVNNQATGKPQILFAGEATHSNLYQTTSGAFLSGQREADRICKLEGLF